MGWGPRRFNPTAVVALEGLGIQIIPDKLEHEALALPDGMTLEEVDVGFDYILRGDTIVAVIYWSDNTSEGCWSVTPVGPNPRRSSGRSLTKTPPRVHFCYNQVP